MRKVRETLTNSANNTLEIEEKIYLGGVEIKKISTVRGNSITTILNRSTLHVMDDKKRISVVHNWTMDNNNREVNSSSDLNVNKTRYQFGNHLDSASLKLDPSGNIISYEEFFPYGDTSFVAGTNQKEVKLKEYRYTGKEKDDATGLYYYGARYYASWVGRWLSADPLFRENPAVYKKPKPKDEEEQKKQDEEFKRKLYSEGLNLYCYTLNNPVKYVDPTGRAIPAIVIGIAIGVSKAIDYGWTAWDTYQSGKVLADQKSSVEDKFIAASNIILAVAFEAIEPDDATPIGLPVDDVARKVTMKGLEKAVKEGGIEGAENFLRKKFGDKADDIIKQIRGKLDDADQGVKGGVTHGHHSFPKFLGGDAKQALTKLPKELHQKFHSDLIKFLKSDYPGMVSSRTNPGRLIQTQYTPSQLRNAMSEFYKGPGAIYKDAATDFFKQFPGLR